MKDKIEISKDEAHYLAIAIDHTIYELTQILSTMLCENPDNVNSFECHSTAVVFVALTRILLTLKVAIAGHTISNEYRNDLVEDAAAFAVTLLGEVNKSGYDAFLRNSRN